MDVTHVESLALKGDNVSEYKFYQAFKALDERYGPLSTTSVEWVTQVEPTKVLDKILEGLTDWDPLHHWRNEYCTSILLLTKNKTHLAEVWYRTDDGTVVTKVSRPITSGMELASEAVNVVKEYCPEGEVGEGEAKVCFSYQNSHGSASNRVRKVKVGTWEEIQDNYVSSTKKGVDVLRNTDPGDTGGKLVLWYGPPGTGKTTAIRGFMDSWRDRADFKYIVDPDNFFGGNVGYMIESITTRKDDYAIDDDEEGGKLLVLIMEDAGELLTVDAKNHTGHGVARLLNIVDGLIGQGLNILLLITTNEPLGDFHPAVARPGRCLQTLEFKTFSARESEQWLKNHGIETPKVDKSKSLAELYQILHGWQENQKGYGGLKDVDEVHYV